MCLNIAAAALHFNPHSRKGSDYALLLHGEEKKNFNPHSRKGSDALDRKRVV